MFTFSSFNAFCAAAARKSFDVVFSANARFPLLAIRGNTELQARFVGNSVVVTGPGANIAFL